MAIFAGYKPPAAPPPPPPPPPPPVDVPIEIPYVEAKRGRAPMRTQSLLFDRSAGWTEQKAKAWAKSHGYKADKVHVTDKYIRIRQFDPKGLKVKRTVPYGKGIRAVVAREESMATTTKEARRPRRRRAAARKPAKKPAATTTRRRTRRVKETPRVAARVKETKRPRHRKVRARVKEAPRAAARVAETKKRRRRSRKVKETARATTRVASRVATRVAETKRRKRRSRAKPKGYVMETKRRKRRAAPKKRRTSREAWFGDSSGHSKAAKKGWRGRKSTKGGKRKSAATESRRPRRSRRVREQTMVAETRRRRRRAPKPPVVASKRRRRRHVREASMPSYGSMARTVGDVALKLGVGLAAYLVADGVDRFLATYDPAAAAKPQRKFTSDGTGTLANALNVASPPDLWRYLASGGLTLAPLLGSLFVKHAMLRSSLESMSVGAGIKLAATLWSNLLMPLLIGKDTSPPALQKSWIARLYPSEVAATLNIKSSTTAIAGATSSGALSGAKDGGPFALADRDETGVGYGRERAYERRWVTPAPWPPAAIAPPIPTFVDPFVPDAPADVPAAPVALAWPHGWGERHRWGLRGVGAAVEDMAHTIATATNVHPAHAVNAAMHAAAEPHDLTLALRRALPHVPHEILSECSRQLHPHVVRMHGHARHPREHAEWLHHRAAEGIPAPEHGAPEHEWRQWHGRRAAAGLPMAPPPPEPPPIEEPSAGGGDRYNERSHWAPDFDKSIRYDRHPTVTQVLGIGYPYPGQPGLGEAFADTAQAVGANVPNVPLENAVNVAAQAATEPRNLERAIERAMPHLHREAAHSLARCVRIHVRRLHEHGGVPMPAEAAAPPIPAAASVAVIEFVPSHPPPGWSKSEAEWHEQERHDWDRAHTGGAVVAAANHAAQAAAAPHPDANKPDVKAAVHAAAAGAAHAANAAPPGTPAPAVAAAAKEGAKAAVAGHAAAGHPAVQAAVAAAGPAAATAAAPAGGVAGLGFPPHYKQVGPPGLPVPGPQPLESDCGCGVGLGNPFIGFLDDGDGEVDQAAE